MPGILEAANQAKVIMARQDVFCPVCHDRQYSPFDKLYTFAYEKCYMCDEDEDEIKSGNISKIIEAGGGW